MSLRNIDKDDRVMIFLDLANAKYGLEDHEGLENCMIDYSDLADTLVEGRKVAGAMVFDTDSYFNSNRSEREYLSEIGFRIVKGHYADDRQKEVDVSIAVNMLMHAINDHYDVAILISGDRDFIPAIYEVQKLGKKVEVAAFRDCTADVMVDVADRYNDLSKIPMVCYHPPSIRPDLEFDGYNSRIYVYEGMEFESLENIIKETKEVQDADIDQEVVE